jgi:hypothetical protein
MSTITQCASYSGRIAPALPLGIIFKILAGLSIVLLFMVAHLHLRFSVNTLQAEMIKLQNDHTRLLAENSEMAAQNESFKQPDRLLSYARHEIGMVPISPTEHEVLSIPSDVQSKYALARASRRQSPLSPEDRLLQQRAVWLSAFGERVGLSANAEARETTHRRRN